MIGALPSLTGAFQATVAWAFPGWALTPIGAAITGAVSITFSAPDSAEPSSEETLFSNEEILSSTDFSKSEATLQALNRKIPVAVNPMTLAKVFTGNLSICFLPTPHPPEVNPGWDCVIVTGSHYEDSMQS